MSRPSTAVIVAVALDDPADLDRVHRRFSLCSGGPARAISCAWRWTASRTLPRTCDRARQRDGGDEHAVGGEHLGVRRVFEPELG